MAGCEENPPTSGVRNEVFRVVSGQETGFLVFLPSALNPMTGILIRRPGEETKGHTGQKPRWGQRQRLVPREAKKCQDRPIEKGVKGGPPPEPTGSVDLLTPQLQTSKLQKHERINFYFFFGTFVCLFLLFKATLMTYGSSQARGWIRAVAASLRHSQSQVRSEPCLRPTPQLTATPDP